MWFEPTPQPSHPSRPERRAPAPKIPPIELSEEKRRKTPPGKAPPTRFARERAEEIREAAQGAPRSGLAPHPEADQQREPFLTEQQKRRRDGPRYTSSSWAPRKVFRVSLDWHGLLDRNVNQVGVSLEILQERSEL